MMLIKLFIFFLLLLILPDWYIYRAYIHRVSQKWIRRAYWIPTLFLVTGMTVIFSIHEPMPDSMYRLSNFLLIFLCFAVPKAIFVIVILYNPQNHLAADNKTTCFIFPLKQKTKRLKKRSKQHTKSVIQMLFKSH